MDQLPGLLARDFGLRPQGKAAPMAAPNLAGSAAISGSSAGDLFGGQQSNHRLRSNEVDDFFGGGRGAAGFSSSMPVYDKPVYDDDDGDIFGGVPGTKRRSSSASTATRRGDVFVPYGGDDLLADLGGANKRSGPAYDHASPPYDGDLLGGLGGLGKSKRSGGSSSNRVTPPYDGGLLSDLGGGKGSRDNRGSGGGLGQSPPSYEDDLLAGLGGVSKRPGNEKRFEEQDGSSFDDLIPGFGGSGLPKHKREPLENNHQQSTVSSTKSTSTRAEDPFVVLDTTSATAYSSSRLFTDPLEHIKPFGSLKSNVSSAKDGGAFDDINGFDGSMKSMPSFSFDMENNHKNRSPLETTGNAPAGVSSAKASDDILPRTVPVDNNRDSYQTLFGKSSKSLESYKNVNRDDGPSKDANANAYEASTKIKASQRPEENCGIADDVWLTVSEIHLFTQPTSSPPPSRPPPPPSFRTRPAFANADEGSSVDSNARIKSDESSSRQPSYLFPRSHNDKLKTSTVSSIDELEDFAMGKPQAYSYEVPSGEEEVDTTSAAAASAAAMKEAMDRAEAKFKHAREVWERERDLRSSKNRETAQQVREEDEKEKGRPDHEREQREREEKEKEQRRLEKMREMELEREKARQVVERANREARERAAVEARQKAERAARERAERVAVQRAQAEARERAAVEAKERAEKLAAERERAEAETRERAAAEVRAARERAAREKAAAEAREKAERAAVERAAAEVRARAQRAAVERAAAEARGRAAAVASEKQQKSENDLDSFFGMGARANSYESAFDTVFQNNGKPAGTQKTSGSSSSMKRPSPTMNIMDDLTSVFRTSPSEEFQEIEGEPEERRRARLEREHRTRERAAKALAEKNERELQMQREQAERDRVAESLNTEIRRWAAGKEGNLRALLSTLQYVLWPDSGWQPVSLTDLITAASVKKVYRKATLSVHPDKVRSGSVQQKYIAEKVFDLLKEAWNKFNSEELF